jgi:hypothetical protein
MPSWRVDDTQGGFRLAPVVRRSLDSQRQTWADLLTGQLGDVRVFVLFFPSRFDTQADRIAIEALRVFGQHTGAGTSVRFWDPTDAEFSSALGLFDVHTPPALVLIPGLRLKDVMIGSAMHVYALTIADLAVLGDRDKLVRAVNTAHEVVLRGNPRELTRFAREHAAASVVAAIAHISAALRDELLKLKPKISLPGGVALQLG